MMQAPMVQAPAVTITELAYIALVFGLFVVPKMLQRARIPSAVTSLMLGIAVAGFSHQFADDATIKLLSTLGIVALFLFAGLEVDFEDFRQEVPVLAQHLVLQLVILGAVAFVVTRVMAVDGRAALLISLALVTPST